MTHTFITLLVHLGMGSIDPKLLSALTIMPSSVFLTPGQVQWYQSVFYVAYVIKIDVEKVLRDRC